MSERQLDMNCTICGAPLSGELDTYGDVGQELCLDCWLEMEGLDDYYYGHFPGGDPRDFTPDPEMCTPEEIAAWQADYAKAEAGETVVCPPAGHWETLPDGGEMRVLAPRYGVGTYRSR